MRILTACIAATIWLAPAAGLACMPQAVEFAFGSVRIDAAGRSELGSIARQFLARPGLSVKLVAETDGSGANRIMSRRRTEAIKAALVRRGVPAWAIIVETRGPSEAARRGGGYGRAVVLEVIPGPGPAPAASH